MNNKLRVGIVGCGIGHAHAWAFQSLPEQYEVLAICDVDRSRAQKVAAEYHVPVALTDLAELCLMDNLDVIDICTPSFLHFSQVEQVLAAIYEKITSSDVTALMTCGPVINMLLVFFTMITRSVRAGEYTAPPAQGPMITDIWGITPELHTLRLNISP